MYQKILNQCSKQDLIEVYDNINNWKWDSRLGEEPNNWNELPDYIWVNHHNHPTKRDIVKPITNFIQQKISEKDLLKYHHINNCDMTEWQHEIWWIKEQISKFFGIGFYNRKSQKTFKVIFTELIKRDKEEWINKTYYKK